MLHPCMLHILLILDYEGTAQTPGAVPCFTNAAHGRRRTERVPLLAHAVATAYRLIRVYETLYEPQCEVRDRKALMSAGAGPSAAPSAAPIVAPGLNTSVNGSTHPSPTQIKVMAHPETRRICMHCRLLLVVNGGSTESSDRLTHTHLWPWIRVCEAT